MTVDRPWATYRLHATSKTTEITQGELLQRSLPISRRYWGTAGSRDWWRYQLSFWTYGSQLGIWSLHRLNLAERAWLGRSRGAFLGNLLLALLLWPPTVIRTLLLPRLWRRGP